MTDVPLFTPALAGVMIQAHWEYPTGWVVVCQVRREGEDWASAGKVRYDRLSTDEMIDVLCAQADLLRARRAGEHGL